MSKTAYLFGEIHGSEAVCLKEFEIWKEFYDGGLRHLFLEIPYSVHLPLQIILAPLVTDTASKSSISQ